MPDICPVNPVRMISTVILIIPLRLTPPDFRVVFRFDRDHRIETDGFAKIETQIAVTSNFPQLNTSAVTPLGACTQTGTVA